MTLHRHPSRAHVFAHAHDLGPDQLADFNDSWHFLELPEEPGKPRRFVATGHIPCFDCDLCAEQGDVRFSDIAPIPWRAFYGDCTDFQDDPEEATSP